MFETSDSNKAWKIHVARLPSFPFIFSSYLFHTAGYLVLILATAGLNKIYHFHPNTTKNGKKKKMKTSFKWTFFLLFEHIEWMKNDDLTLLLEFWLI